MSALLTLSGVGASFVPSLIVRSTVFLAAAWVVHAALATRNPRWRVALWRGVAIGAAAIPLLVAAPPVVRWRLPRMDRPQGPARIGAPERSADVIPERERLSVQVRHPAEQASSDVVAPGAAGARGIGRPERASAAGAGGMSRFPLGQWLLGVWASGVVVLIIHRVRQVRRLSAIIGRGESVPDEVFAGWAAPAGMPAVRVVRSAEVGTPCLARVWRPVLLLPDRLGSGGDRAEMRAILAHELAHARGHDLAWNEALALVSIVGWFHPLFWRVRGAHAAACDAVCDALAADQLEDVAAYTRALARLALRAAGAPPAGSLAMARVSDVRRRIESLNRRVFRAPIPRRLTVPAAVAFGVAVVLVGGLGFARAGQEPAAKAVPAADAQDNDEPKVPATKLSASGTVVDARGKPIAGARVILREWSVYRIRGMNGDAAGQFDRGDGMPDALAETTTDAEGRFRFDRIPAPEFSSRVEGVGQTVFPWDVVALAEGHGLAWVQLTRRRQTTPIVLALGDEGILRGRIVEPGGAPVAGARVKVYGIDPLGKPDLHGLVTENRLNLIWSSLLGTTTGADGRFTIPRLPRDRVIGLSITDPRHERRFVFAATTETPQAEHTQRGIEPDGQARETRWPVHAGAFTLELKRTDHVLTGRIILKASGKPAAGAHVVAGWKRITAVADGRYRIEGLASGPLDLQAYPGRSDALPIDLKIEIPEEPKQVERNLVLPPGVVVTGRVVDAVTGRGVEKAGIRFASKPAEGGSSTYRGSVTETDAEGRYRGTLPPGKMTAELYSVPLVYTPPGKDEVREAEGRAGQTVEAGEFRLARAPAASLRVVDPDGRPVPSARVDVRDHIRWPHHETGNTDAQGRYTAVGLAAGQVTVVDIIADDPRLGATIEVDMEHARDRPVPITVRLEPLVSLSGRVLDDAGRPLRGSSVKLYRAVMYPGQNSRSFGPQVDALDGVAADGTYTFDKIIPGATYSTSVNVDGYASSSSNHVKVKPGQPARFDDFRLPQLHVEVSGVVVDPRGKPLAGVTVSYERNGESRALYAPVGAVWFHDTDASGRFHLTGLPRGPVRLAAYRHPGEGQHAIRGMQYVDAQPGQTDVRIELRDPNDRLRGID